MNQPKVSVIIPVYNAEKYLRECLDSVVNQTLRDIEIICVDDGSTDGSLGILREYEAKDSRFRVFTQNRLFAGVARNQGFSHAIGKYCIFLDADDYFEHNLLEKCYEKAEADKADIVAFNFYCVYESGNEEKRIGIHTEWLPKIKTVFNYRDCPDYIMSVVNPTSWTKLYRTAFIAENHLKYEEISTTNDITFAAVSVAAAKRISVLNEYLVHYRTGQSGTISSAKPKRLGNVLIAVKSGVMQASLLPHFASIKNSVMRFAVENITFALKNNIPDFRDSVAEDYYTEVNAFYHAPLFAGCSAETLHSEMLYHYFCFVRDNPCDDLRDYSIRKLTDGIVRDFIRGDVKPGTRAEHTFREKLDHQIIVSLTSYPPRIETVHKTIRTLLRQSLSPDKLILWLSDEEFPNKELDLPAELTELTKSGLEIAWCDNIRSYKKLIPALKLYPDAIIVTADDDLYYHPQWLERLYSGYLDKPDCIQCHRVTKFRPLDDGSYSIVPGGKDYWPFPCYLNKLTGGSGALYPPHCFHPDVLDASRFMALAPTSDDIWFWLMAAMAGYRVNVVQEPLYQLSYVEGSQDCALWKNNDQGEKLFWVHFNRLLDAYPQVEHRLRMASREVSTAETALERSVSYRIGRAITWLPRKFRGGVRCYQEHGFRYTFNRLLVHLHLIQDPEKALKKDYAYYSTLSPQNYPKELKQWYHRAMRKDLDLRNPRTFNEKIQWMKLYDATPLKTRLADKYLVREWVKEKIGEEYLVPLLGVWDSFDEIDFDRLPDRFVLKANHGCGWNIIVKDKSMFDKDDAKKKFDQWMHTNFAFMNGFELHYMNIPPKIIAEQYLENNNDDLYDYKVFCFNGKADSIMYLSERKQGLKMSFYDLNWNKLPFVYSYPQNEDEIPKPSNLELLIELAEKCAEGFPHVRVDFYIMNDGSIKFGEMTFTSAAGTCKWTVPEQDLIYGEMIKLPPKSAIPKRL